MAWQRACALNYGEVPAAATTQRHAPLPRTAAMCMHARHVLHAVCTSLLKEAHDDCDLKGLERTVLTISGVVVEASELVYDKDPWVFPRQICAGQDAWDYYSSKRRTAGNHDTSTDRNMRGEAKRRPWDLLTPDQRANTTRKARAGPRKSGGATAPTTYWRGSGRIYSGTVYAVRNGEGMVAVGLFHYVRPWYTPPSVIDTEFDPFEPLTSKPEGVRAYTPFEYNLQLTPGHKAETYSRLASTAPTPA